MTPVGGHQPHCDRASWAVLARLRAIRGAGLARPPYPPSPRGWGASGGGALQLPKQVRGAVVADEGWKLVVADAAITGLENMTLHLPVTLGDDGRARAAATSNSGDFTGLLRSDGFITLPPRGGVSAAFPFTPWL